MLPFSYALFDMDGNQVPHELAVGITLEQILEEISKVRDEQDADMSISQAFSIVFSRKPELRLEGLAQNVLQWYLCRMEGWFAANADTISVQCWDQVSCDATIALCWLQKLCLQERTKL